MKHVHELCKRIPALAFMEKDLESAATALCECFAGGGKLLLCGNGGSAADCDHIAGELLKGFLSPRPLTGKTAAAVFGALGGGASALQGGLSVIPLPALTAGMTAFANDCDPALVFAQLTLSLGKPGDILLAISTSGNSENVVAAAKIAEVCGMRVIGMTGRSGGRLAAVSDILLAAPEEETYRIQEYHLPIYHALCAAVEERLFPTEKNKTEERI